MSPHRRTPWLTTPSHPFVLAFYAALFVLGVLGSADQLNPQSMIDRYGEVVADLWHLSRVLAGALSVSGAIGATISLLKSRDPRWYLAIELVGVLAIFGAQSFYEWTLYQSFGFGTVIETQVLTIAFALAAFVRAAQLPFQMILWKKTQRVAR